MKIAIAAASWFLIAWPAVMLAQEAGIERSTQRAAVIEAVIVGSQLEQAQQKSPSNNESEETEDDEEEDEPDCE